MSAFGVKRNTAPESTPSREEIKAADKLWRDWAKTDRRKAKEALKEPLTAAGVSLEAFADKEQAEWTGLRPPQGGPRQACPGPRAKVILDENGVPLAWVFPGFLGKNANDVLFEQLQEFSDAVDVTPKSKRRRAGADANTRNKSSSYKHMAFVGERLGCWSTFGEQWATPPGPTTKLDPPPTSFAARDFNAAAKLMDQLRVVSKHVDHMIECGDPVQHAELHRAREELRAQNPAYKLLSQLDPSYFHGRSLIFATPWHTDKRDKNAQLRH
ncbi:hypothetical protein AURDEDRAFT_172623 [Auricularia subglabra TFB-10046 SS5]|nr:hypothetical protein AURDEDRAFT_172623 [Auricularia subglabra TFB-10046 SS5]